MDGLTVTLEFLVHVSEMSLVEEKIEALDVAFNRGPAESKEMR
jgi:hypothetical protein